MQGSEYLNVRIRILQKKKDLDPEVFIDVYIIILPNFIKEVSICCISLV